jgi:hypothetical protein
LNKYFIYEEKLYLRLIFLFIPPVTLIVIIRNYIRLQLLMKRLNTIYRNTEELMWIIKNTEALK